MAKKLKMTVFTKFLIFLIFAAPAAYIGASYYNGQDGLQNFKSLFSKEKTDISNNSSKQDDEEATITKTHDTKVAAKLTSLQKDLSYYKQRVAELERENNQLKEQIQKLEQKK